MFCYCFQNNGCHANRRCCSLPPAPVGEVRPVSMLESSMHMWFNARVTQTRQPKWATLHYSQKQVSWKHFKCHLERVTYKQHPTLWHRHCSPPLIRLVLIRRWRLHCQSAWMQFVLLHEVLIDVITKQALCVCRFGCRRCGGRLQTETSTPHGGWLQLTGPRLDTECCRLIITLHHKSSVL